MEQNARILTDEEEKHFHKKLLGLRATQLLLIPSDGSKPNVLPFSLAKVLSYCAEWCADGNDCSDGMFELDCTHFISHALSKTRVLVNLPETTCTNGVCIRVAELAAAFFNSTRTYSNVKKIASHGDTRRGDFCFIPGFFGLTKLHAMILADAATATGAKVFGHTNSRCGEYIDFEGEKCSYYRVE
ncbi:hypothetical protein ACW7BC_22215 [Azospirillum argentinense]